MYKLFLALRYLRKKLIALFAVASVTLCVFMVLVVISVMGGFLEMVRERSRGLLSDIVVDNGSLQGFPYYADFIDYLKREMPDTVVAATPVIYNYGILRVPGSNYTKPVRVVGIRLHEYEQVNDFANSLYYDQYYPSTTSLGPQYQPFAGYDERGNVRLPDDFEKANRRWRETADRDELNEYKAAPFTSASGERVFARVPGQPGYYGEEKDELPGIIVGRDLLHERSRSGKYIRYYPLGMDLLLTVVPITPTGTLTGSGSTTLKVRYADDSRTGVFEIDSLNIYADFDMLQRVLMMGPLEKEDGTFSEPRASQVLVALAPGVEAKVARPLIERKWEQFRATLPDEPGSNDYHMLQMVQIETWEERQRAFIQAVEKEKVLVTILFAIVSVVAVVLIGCIFYMVVEKKTRDIGIIKSLGASSRGVAWIFIAYGAAVGVVGSVLGGVSGAVFVRYINEIQDLLTRINPNLQVWSPDVYTFDRIPNTVDPKELAVIVIVAIVASMLGALIPAILAARVWPVNALRYE